MPLHGEQYKGLAFKSGSYYVLLLEQKGSMKFLLA